MAVEFISYGYDTLPGEGLGELTWQEMFPQIGAATYGVRSPGDWKVTKVSGADRTVSIAAGRGWGLGVIDKTVANDTIQLDPIASGSRWDLIAVRRDPTPTGGESKFIKINGGASAVIPGARLSGPGIHDQPLALVQVIAGQTQPGSVIDVRCWAVNGGMVARDTLALTYLNQLGTEVYIDGEIWRYVPGLNDIPEWVRSLPLNGAGDVSTFGPGWTALTSSHKPRLRTQGNMVHLIGGVKRNGGNAGYILAVPEQFWPSSSGAHFVGSGVTDTGIAYELVLQNGILSIPIGYATRTDASEGTIYPVTASWTIE